MLASECANHCQHILLIRIFGASLERRLIEIDLASLPKHTFLSIHHPPEHRFVECRAKTEDINIAKQEGVYPARRWFEILSFLILSISGLEFLHATLIFHFREKRTIIIISKYDTPRPQIFAMHMPNASSCPRVSITPSNFELFLHRDFCFLWTKSFGILIPPIEITFIIHCI